MKTFLLNLKWFGLTGLLLFLAIALRGRGKTVPKISRELEEARQGVVDAIRKEREKEADTVAADAAASSLDDWIQSELDKGGDKKPPT